MSDPYAELKDNAWREFDKLDERLARGELDEEHEAERTTEEPLDSWGVSVTGRSVRANRRKPGMEDRVL